MAYGAILGQTPTASNVTYNNSQTSSIITGTNVQQAIDQLFTSVSNGKALIAGAITDKGVSTSASDTFQQMATNIGQIETGVGNGYVLSDLGNYSSSYKGMLACVDSNETVIFILPSIEQIQKLSMNEVDIGGGTLLTISEDHVLINGPSINLVFDFGSGNIYEYDGRFEFYIYQ